MDQTGLLDLHYQDVEDLARARKLSSLQLSGCHDDALLDINTLSARGIEFVGRFAGVHNNKARFSGSLANMCTLADLKLNRMLDGIDEWIEQSDIDGQATPTHRFEPTQVSNNPRLELDLSDGSVKTIIWATGFKPDYSWLDVPVLDRKGMIEHDGGVVNGSPGMYLIGMPFLRRRKSTLIDGVGDDACDLSAHLSAWLRGRRASRAAEVPEAVT